MLPGVIAYGVQFDLNLYSHRHNQTTTCRHLAGTAIIGILGIVELFACRRPQRLSETVKFNPIYRMMRRLPHMDGAGVTASVRQLRPRVTRV